LNHPRMKEEGTRRSLAAKNTGDFRSCCSGTKIADQTISVVELTAQFDFVNVREFHKTDFLTRLK
jgi:hypothetical protein